MKPLQNAESRIERCIHRATGHWVGSYGNEDEVERALKADAKAREVIREELRAAYNAGKEGVPYE